MYTQMKPLDNCPLYLLSIGLHVKGNLFWMNIIQIINSWKINFK